MLKIANIIHDTELVNHNILPYINYFNLKNSNQLNYDKNLPTLFVGWNLYKKFNEYSATTILNKEITPNSLYWEFSFNESKSQHVSGLELHCINIFYYYFNNKFKYYNFDPLFSNIYSIDDINNKLPLKFDVMYNYNNELVYCLIDKNIYGFDLNVFEFFNIPKDLILNTLQYRSSNYIMDSDKNYYQKYSEIVPYFDDLKRYLIVFLSKD